MLLRSYYKSGVPPQPKCGARIQESGVRNQNNCVRFADGYDFLVFIVLCGCKRTINYITALSVGQRFIDFCASEEQSTDERQLTDNTQSSKRTVRVLGIFRNSVNLRANSEILTIVSKDIGRSASSLMIDNVSRLMLTIDEIGYCQVNNIRFLNSEIDFFNAPVWRGCLVKTFVNEHRNKLSWESICVLKSALRRGDASKPNSAWCEDNEVNRLWEISNDASRLKSVWCEDSISSLIRGIVRLPDDPESAVRGLIGLGPGLTPAGDDVILGFLSVINHFSDDNDYLQKLRNTISVTLHATTDLSAQFLKNALRYDYHEYIEGVLTALCDTPESIVPAVTKLLGIGATSGYAIATGMYNAAVFCLNGNIDSTATTQTNIKFSVI